MIRITPLVRENLNVALRSIKSNRLRSALTIIMIAVGITSLLGILTATEALKVEVKKNFERLGAKSFYIQPDYYRTEGDSKGKRIRNNLSISYLQATTFKSLFAEQVSSVISVYTRLNGQTIKYQDRSTNPDAAIYLVDEDYIEFANLKINSGRALSENDIKDGLYVCVIGSQAANKLFDPREEVVGKNVSVGGISYRIIGVLEKPSGNMMGGVHNSILIPLSNGRARFVSENTSWYIAVKPYTEQMSNAQVRELAEQTFRSVRRLSPYDQTDFYISYNESMMQSTDKTLSIITLIAGIIGLITLLGAAIGLMNIMLVSVKERTAEIGVRKAIGASAKIIRQQFLFESIVIAQIGCIIGVVLGFLAGNWVASLMQASFVVPWLWIFIAIVTCFIVGISSGYLPAKRAAALDPIEALRYE